MSDAGPDTAGNDAGADAAGLGATSEVGITSIAVDTTDVYWSTAGPTGGHIASCAKSGCVGAPRIIADNQGAASHVILVEDRVVWLADDNVRDNPATDADKTNLFRTGTMVPIQMRVYACDGSDVSSTVGATLDLHLTVSYHTGVAGAEDVAIVPDYVGTGDEGGLLVYTGTMFRYNLSTNRFEYPAGTINNTGYFTALVTATYIASPDVVVAVEDARLESK